MQLHEIDPLRDPRWMDLVERSDASSVFHTAQWLDALWRTYGYEPVAFTDAGSGERLDNGVVFCRVRSWLTGRRLVSLPFSDHCEPLVEGDGMERIAGWLKGKAVREGRYIELRPLNTAVNDAAFTRAAEYCHHAIDLRPAENDIFANFHRNHVRRTITRALRLGVRVDVGRSASQLTEFYGLHRMTRARHGLPVQPFAWFRNLLDCLGEQATLFVARYDGVAVAAMFTAAHKQTLVYKYGCSDAAMHRYGGPSLLFWTAIQEAKRQKFVEFDLGRSDWDDHGLLAFKDHLGGRRRTLSYYRYERNPPAASAPRLFEQLRTVYSLIPRALQTRVGTALYRHFG